MTMLDQDHNSPDIAGLVRGAVARDRGAWERLVDQYARLIWSITADFKLAESDAADVAQTAWLRLLEHIHRLEYPDRVGGDRAERVPGQPGGAQEARTRPRPARHGGGARARPRSGRACERRVQGFPR
jgi:Sigma-70 region 2